MVEVRVVGDEKEERENERESSNFLIVDIRLSGLLEDTSEK